MRRRPTIPLAEWRIAVQLEATRAIQNQAGTPAYGCACKDCSAWRQHWHTVLPADIAGQLQRIGIDLDHPSDLYAYEKSAEGIAYRAIFHCIGELQSGPNTWKEQSDGSKLLNYRPVRTGQDFLLMAVYPHKQTFLKGPINPMPTQGESIQIDMRFFIQ